MIHPSLETAFAALGIRCRLTQPIPQKGFLRLHADGDRPGSKNVALCRCKNGLGYLKLWTKGCEALFQIADTYGSACQTISAQGQDIKAEQLIRTLLSEAPLCTQSDYFSEKKLAISDLRLRTVTARDLHDRYHYTLLGSQNKPYAVIPIYAIEAGKPVLRSAQLIGGTPPRKHFLKGGKKKGGFWLVRPIPKSETAPIIGVAEGVATAISVWKLFRDMGQLTTVAAAFDCGNLLPVCKSMRKRWPKAQIIVFADNDCPETDTSPNLHCSPNNAGVIHAIKACRAVGARLHAPSFNNQILTQFKQAKGCLPTDWNDFLCASGGRYGN